VQAVITGAALVILAALLVVERRSQGFSGRTFWSYLLLYSIARFVIEFYRGDPRGTIFDSIPTSQFLSALIIPVSLFMLFFLGRNHPKNYTSPKRRVGV